MLSYRKNINVIFDKKSEIYSYKPEIKDIFVRSLIKVGILALIITSNSHYSFAQNDVGVNKINNVNKVRTIVYYDAELSSLGLRENNKTDVGNVFKNAQNNDIILMTSALCYGCINNIYNVEKNGNSLQNDGIDKIISEEDSKYNKGNIELDSSMTDQHQHQHNFDSGLTLLKYGQMDGFGDYSVQDALARFSGVQVNHLGEINVRGVGLDNYNVTINGRNMSTTGMGGRNFNLSSISIDMINDLELIKINTPNMRADALAGTVNLITRRPVSEDRKLGGFLGGGATSRYFEYTGVESRAMFNYSQKFSDNVHFAIDLNQMQYNRGWESLDYNYDVIDFGEGVVDVLEQITPSLHTYEQSNLGGHLQLIYQPSDLTKIYVNGFLNNAELNNNRHSYIWDTGGEWISHDTTGNQTGSHIYDASQINSNTNNFILSTGASHIFESFDLRYNVTWSQGRFRQSKYQFPFRVERLDFIIDMEDRTRPSMEVINVPLLEDGNIDPRRYSSQPVDRVISDHIDNTFSGDIDLKIPIRIGSIEMGSSVDLTYQSGDYTDTKLELRRGVSLRQYRLIKRGDFDPLNTYNLPYLLNIDDTRTFLNNNRPDFTKNLDLEHERSDIKNYNVNEQIYSGYGMTTLNINRFSLLLGARLEHTSFSSEGRNVMISDDGKHQSTTIEDHNNKYTHIFPNVQLLYTPHRQINMRLALTQSIARPDFSTIAPFIIENERDSLIYQGNPDLDPVNSNNLDLLFEYNYQNTGVVSMGLFYKKLSGIIKQKQSNIVGGEYYGWQERTYINRDDDASIHGVELSLQKNFNYLPGFLSRLTTYTNYTWSSSEYVLDNREDNVSIPGHSPHVVNAALQYTQGPFTGQVAYHWTSTAISRLSESPVLLPSIDSGQPIYSDTYQDGWKDLSASIRIQITDEFRFWADVSNLLSDERTQYDHTRELYPRHTKLRGGIELRAGLRMDL